MRAFAIRWINKPLTETAFLMEAGGVGTLSYEHKNIKEPAILLGGGFVVDDPEQEIKEGLKTWDKEELARFIQDEADQVE